MPDGYFIAQIAFALSHVLLATIASGHALLYKRDQRAALGWIATCLLFPVMGSLMYYMFGINRVRARAHSLTDRSFWKVSVPHERGEVRPATLTPRSSERLGLEPDLARFADISDTVIPERLHAGNAVTVLQNGESAFPAMLRAIDEAETTVLLMSYIMYTDDVGQSFIDALTRAQKRGVNVQIILDGIGDYYSWPRASSVMSRAGLNVVRFLPPRLLPPSFLVNLRNHGKLLLLDDRMAFTGGMNISDKHRVEITPVHKAVQDMHFLLEGPIVADLARHFHDTWSFATGAKIEAPSAGSPSGDAICRMLLDGPDENMDRLELILIGTISSAKHSIDIMTPYFLPTRDIMAALKAAALRGVHVRVILPRKSNLPYVDWATRNLLWELLQWQVQIYYQPLPFAHTKLFIVDRRYCIVGSANLDPRSLRLNFELCIEVFDRALAAELLAHCETTIQRSTLVCLEDVDQRGIPTRLRDAFCWLFAPYL